MVTYQWSINMYFESFAMNKNRFADAADPTYKWDQGQTYLSTQKSSLITLFVNFRLLVWCKYVS